MTTEAPATPVFKDIVPEEFRDKPYLKEYLDKPWDAATQGEFFKKFDGAQALIGKKFAPPADDAPDDEVEKFHSSLRPAKPEDYGDITKLGEKADPEFAKALPGLLHKSGATKAQAKILMAGIKAFFGPKEAAALKAQADHDAEFDKLIEATYSKDATAKLERATGVLKELLPANLRQFVEGLDNKSLAVVTGITNALLDKYASEDDLGGDKGGAGGDSQDAATLREEAKKLMGSEAYKSTLHKDHAKTKARVDEIYANPVFKGAKK